MNIKPVKQRIQEIILEKKLKKEEKDVDNLTSLSLLFTYNKPYFNNRFSDFFLVRNKYGAIRFNSPKFNDVSGARNHHLERAICSPNLKQEFEDDYFFEEYEDGRFYDEDIEDYVEIKQIHDDVNLFLKGHQMKHLVDFYNSIKDSKNQKELSKKLNEFVKDNEEALSTFETVFKELANNHKYPIYEWMCRTSAIKGDFKHPLNKSNFRKFGEIKQTDRSGITDDSFKEEFDSFIVDYKNKLKTVKNTNELVNENRKELSVILETVYKEYPELNKEVSQDNIDELDYYLVEIPAKENMMSFSKAPMTFSPEKNKLNRTGFKTTDENKNFVDFMFDSPYFFSKNNHNKDSAIEGLVYINDGCFEANDTVNHFFIVAKTKKNETAGVISLHQAKEYSHFSKIGEISVKHNYRQKGLAKKLYTKVAELAINNDLIVTNRMYSSMGRSYLPKMKEQVQKENEGFLIINSSFGQVFENKALNEAIESYNQATIQELQIEDKMKTIDVKSFKKAYFQGLEQIKSDSKNVGFSAYKAKTDALLVFKDINEGKSPQRSRFKLQ